MVSGKRIIITPASNVLAHAGRCALLARELKRRGHRIILAGTARYLRDAEVAGDEFEYYRLPDFEAEDGLEILRTLRKVPSKRLLEEHVSAELKMLDELRPDLAIIDFRLTMFISAKLRAIPTVSLLGGRWLYQYSARPYRAFRTYPYYSQLKSVIGGRGADLFVPFFLRLALRYKMRPYRSLLRKHGLQPKRNPWELFIGDYNLILDSELLAPTRNLPENFTRVGPIYWTADRPMPAWVKDLKRDRPIIYVTMGSTGHPSLFSKLIDLLGRKDYQVIMTTGGQLEIASQSLPLNFRVEKFLPGERMMELADLVICHGGAGTVYQAIRTGTPVIAIATHFEQELLGQQIEGAGAGMFLGLHEVVADAKLVEAAMMSMLNNIEIYKQSMKKLQQEHLSCDAVKSAAEAIEGFLNHAMCQSGYAARCGH